MKQTLKSPKKVYKHIAFYPEQKKRFELLKSYLITRENSITTTQQFLDKLLDLFEDFIKKRKDDVHKK